jgi:ABC-2 type transport system ATP-binding protein
MEPDNAIEIRNVSKSFIIQVADDSKKTVSGRTKIKKVKNKVLDDITLNIKKGDVLGILGRNGSGKSTFLSLLARIMEPDEGTISRSGKIAAILELGMGFHQDMTGRENIYIKGELYGFSKKEMDSKIEGIIDYSGVRMYIDNPVRTYSSGMIGRLAFAIMVNVESDIILVDEVLSVGDSSFSAKAMQHFNEMAESGKTVLIVSHNLGYVEQACNRVIWIENGKVALDGNPADVCAQYQNRINEDPEIILDLAQSGVPDAQYRLALMYRDGNYFQKDKA